MSAYCLNTLERDMERVFNDPPPRDRDDERDAYDDLIDGDLADADEPEDGRDE